MGNTKPDITSVEDIKKMVDTFYERVNRDDLLSPVFNDFAKVDWPSHLPRMYAFWESILLGKTGFQGHPFRKHIPLPIDSSHFDRWISLFVTNVDAHFEGPVCEEAKLRARSIGHIFLSKLETLRKFES